MTESNIDPIVMKYIIDNKIDLFVFMNLENKFSEDEYFTDRYIEKLKRHHRRNSTKFHPDKNQNCSPEEQKENIFKFYLNNTILKILSHREIWNEYKSLIQSTSKTSIELKKEFKNNKDEIRAIFENDTKTYEEKAREKEKQHGIIIAKDEPIDMKTFATMLESYERDRQQFKNDLQHTIKKEEYDKNKFNETFDAMLIGDISNSNHNNAIMPYCETVGTISNVFDIEKQSYDILYSMAGTFDSSFELLSSHIDKNKPINDMNNYEEAIKNYHNTTKEIDEQILAAKKTVNTNNLK